MAAIDLPGSLKTKVSQPLSLVITTLDNAATIGQCILSVRCADEILVLDSFSQDETVEIARSLGAKVVQEAFRGYGPQKQRAIELASHDLILLLDADESLDARLAGEIQRIVGQAPGHKAYRLLREEWLYWRWPARGTGLTDHLRLFDRRHVRMGRHPVHAAPEYPGTSPLLKGRLRHFGHRDIAGQLERINAYTAGGLEWSGQRRGGWVSLRLILSPTAAFIREYLFRRQFLNGWAGYLASRMAAWHAFLRYAKLMEARRNKLKG
jgi:glycosyltransferase involved in cell wall biosynthesis